MNIHQIFFSPTGWPIGYSQASNQLPGAQKAYREMQSDTIGEDYRLAAGVIVCPGVNIGKRCVIGAGSVVVNDIPDDSMAVGNPAHVIKKLNNE